jgi:uncharacterized protein (UPF0333 family)
MASFLKIYGANLATASSFDAIISCRNIAALTATATTVVINYAVGSTGSDIVTITIPSDTSGNIQRELQNIIIQNINNSEGVVDVQPLFANGQSPGTNSKISTVVIA